MTGNWKWKIPKKELQLLLFMAAFGLVKQFLIYNLPIMAVPKGIHDDWIMVHLAETLRNRQWLGAYNSLTLTKGMFFPFYLAVCNFLHLSYLNITALCYTGSCMLFVYGLRPLLKKYWVMGAVYLALLWNPISYSAQAFQRVYRNSISYIQVLLIFGGFLAIYLRRKESLTKQIFWILAAALGTASFFYTREDAVWVVPFLLVFLVVYWGSIFGLWRETKERNYIGKGILVLVPLLCLWLTGQAIAAQNEKYYGIRTTNELQDSGFSEMYKSMMAVKPKEDIPGVTLTGEKIARMCDACPTLKELEPYFQSSKEYWAGPQGDADNWEVRDGWAFWIVRTALEQAGYYENGAMANEICLKIRDNCRDEREAAMDKGILERQATMPSTYMSPWREGYLGDLLGAMGKAIAYTATYQEMETLVYLYSEPDENGGNLLFERMTNDKTVWYESDLIELAGWYAAYDGMEDVVLRAETTDGTVLESAEFTESEDIAAFLDGQNRNVKGAERCRFHLKLYVEDKTEPVVLRTYRGNELLDTFELGGSMLEFETDNSCLRLDWYWDVPERHGLLADINYKGVILNGIHKLYQITGGVLGALGLIAWVIISIRAFQSVFLKKDRKNEAFVEEWLTLTSLLFSYLVLLGGISYSEISGWNAILYWYLSGAYPILIAFEVLALVFLVRGRRIVSAE